MDVEAPVFGGADETGRDKETEGDGNNQVDGVAAWPGHLELGVSTWHRRVEVRLRVVNERTSQPVNVSRTWIGSLSWSASDRRGTGTVLELCAGDSVCRCPSRTFAQHLVPSPRRLTRSDHHVNGPDEAGISFLLLVQRPQRHTAELVGAAEEYPQRVRRLGGRAIRWPASSGSCGCPQKTPCGC